jgi:hypothetical protein
MCPFLRLVSILPIIEHYFIWLTIANCNYFENM